MSSAGSAQISPRILSAYERLETAVERLKQVAEVQKDKVDVQEVTTLQGQLEGLKQDNLALSEALEAYAEVDHDAQFEQLNEKLEVLQGENEKLQSSNASLQETNTTLKEMNSDFSNRLGKLIGNVQQVLEEE